LLIILFDQIVNVLDSCGSKEKVFGTRTAKDFNRKM